MKKPLTINVLIPFEEDENTSYVRIVEVEIPDSEFQKIFNAMVSKMLVPILIGGAIGALLAVL